ncbi:MAG: potassium channel family protein [Chitinophagales bacterium]
MNDELQKLQKKLNDTPDKTYRGPIALAALLLIDFLFALTYQHHIFCYRTIAIILSITTVLGFVTIVIMFYDGVYYLAKVIDKTVTLWNVGLSGVYVIFFFAMKYCILYFKLGHDHFYFANDPSPDVIDFFYFTIITIATVGFGDITPLSTLAKLTVCLEVITGISFLIFIISDMDSIASSAVKLRKSDEHYYEQIKQRETDESKNDEPE